ncbi:hypothetical protein KA005_83170 [bacterium]|nr:hypothetical protein [bacterium]
MNDDTAKEKKKEPVSAYIVNVITSMLFPFMVIWFGPKYLLKKEYVKGIVIILIVVVELVILSSIFEII